MPVIVQVARGHCFIVTLPFEDTAQYSGSHKQVFFSIRPRVSGSTREASVAGDVGFVCGLWDLFANDTCIH